MFSLEIHNRPSKMYWSNDNILQLDTVPNFTELSRIAMEVLHRMPRPVIQICGPLSSGGEDGNIDKNNKALDAAIQFFTDKGVSIFDQLPFQGAMTRLYDPSVQYDDRILNEFYLPIFKSGYIEKLGFLHNWASSRGACWEYVNGKNLRIPTVILPKELETCDIHKLLAKTSHPKSVSYKT